LLSAPFVSRLDLMPFHIFLYDHSIFNDMSLFLFIHPVT
jgi:hypothetical protein